MRFRLLVQGMGLGLGLRLGLRSGFGFRVLVQGLDVWFRLWVQGIGLIMC